MLNMTQVIRIIGLVISLWGINVASFAGNGITASVHRYRGNDEYVKMEVAGISAGDSRRDQVWDFSGATILDGNMNIMVKEVFKDSVYHEIRNRTFYKYSLRNDTLYWHGLENRLTNVNDANGVAVMKYPFVLGDSLAGSYCLTGEYSKSTSYIEKGIMIHVADATGRIIMPHGIIDDVLRVKSCRKFAAMVSDTIRFRVIPNIADGSCTLTIGNDARKIVAGTGYFYFNKTLSSGTYNVSLDFDNVDSRGNVIVYPVEVTGTKGETVNTGAIHIFR